MMHWHELITHVYLVRGCRAWCPLCYNYWYQKKLPLYEPLLWSFEPVAICSHHHYPLITQCPNCHHKLSILAANSRLGYCNHCGEWLGNLEKSKLLSHTLYHYEITLQSELINIIGSLITLSSLVFNDAKKIFYRQILTYFQLKELEITELSNHQISQKRVHRAMTYTGSTAQDFWRLLSEAAL